MEVQDDTTDKSTSGFTNQAPDGVAAVPTITIGGIVYPLVDALPKTGSRTAHNVMPAPLITKIGTSFSRLEMIRALDEAIVASKDNIILEQAAQWRSEAENNHRIFSDEHKAFQDGCTVALLGHDYYKKDVVGVEYKWYSSAMRHLNAAVKALPPVAPSQTHLSSDHSKRFPEIKLITFKGDYADWAGFMQLFTSLVKAKLKQGDGDSV